MLQITKIFRFEMAHAVFGYKGKCQHIHGHSYVLHVSVTDQITPDNFIAAPGFIIDFKDLKKIVNESVIDGLDHKLVLSNEYLAANKSMTIEKNIIAWNAEPTAENILIYTKNQLQQAFPAEVKLKQLLLFETADSYAEWIDS
jgi:6-pyruvoyltetrahydropterin/6-carboxytetrahydropterin synthase